MKTARATTVQAPQPLLRRPKERTHAVSAVPDHRQLTKLTYFRGRVALAALLRALGVGHGHEVAIQAFTCVAVPEGVMATGAKPAFVDIEPGGFNIDPSALEKAITPATRAIVVQHSFGIPAQIDRIMSIADAAGVPVIEDCCHVFGSTLGGRLLGSFGIGSFYSFEWGKPVVAGLGGAAVANDRALHDRLVADYDSYQHPSIKKRLQLEIQFRAFSVLYRPQWYWQVRSAFHVLSKFGAAAGNFRLNNDRCGMSPEFWQRMSPPAVRRLASQAKRVDSVQAHARRIAEQYENRIVRAIHPILPPTTSVCYARYPLRVTNKLALLETARRRGVELGDWYRTAIHPLHSSEMGVVEYVPGSCPQAETRANEVVSLPTSKKVNQRYVDKTVELLNNA